MFSAPIRTVGVSFLEPTARGSLKIEPSTSTPIYRRLRKPTHRQQQEAIQSALATPEDFETINHSAAQSDIPSTPQTPYFDLSEELASLVSPVAADPIPLSFTNYRRTSASFSSTASSLTPVSSLSSPIEMTTTHVMPIRGERGAPTFDQKRPNELGRYFTQLETLFTRCQVANDGEKKQYAVSFVESEVADSWEALPEYTDNTKTYANFKRKLFEIYNQLNMRYILSDLDRLVGERQRLGINSLQDLSEFHLRFNAIASYLITNQLISAREQSQAYLRVFSESLQGRVMMRLQISHPNHHPALPYAIGDILEAAKWVMQGIPGALGSSMDAPVPTSSSDSRAIKTEDLGSFLSELAKTIADAVTASNNRNNAPSNSSQNGPPRNQRCNFDGCEKFIRDCPGVEEYIRLGRCRRNFEGKVVLPSGAFVPRSIQGQYLRDRIDEWHRQFPNQLASGSLFHAVVTDEQKETPRIVEVSPTSTFLLSAQDRIAALEAELFNLRVRHQPDFVPVIKTRKQRAAEKNAGGIEAEVTQPPKDDARLEAPKVPVVQPSASTNREVTPQPLPEPAPQTRDIADEAREHPFRNAKDAVYAPPQNRNVGAPVKVPAVVKKAEPAYRNAPAIHDAKIATDVYHRALETPVTITYHELLSLAPEVRAQVRDAITSKRVTNKENVQANLLQEASLTEEELSYLMPDEIPLPFDSEETVPAMTFSKYERRRPTSGAIIVEDPIDQYYRNLEPGEVPDPDRLVVAKESSALRSIIPLVDNQLKVEAILDPGCQIVAMSEDVCHELGLPYDPRIVLNMQSANGAIDPSLGLARNVPFLIGELTFYMQVHVIRNPAYDILLGRPFDVLTESVVRNFRNEDQTITVHDPNSERVVTIPTSHRGPPRILSKCNHAGFR